METRYLATLVKVAETQSFSKAAQELHITQSAVSQRIKFLEESYGQKLFDRSGQVLELTALGKIVRVKASKILEIEQELKREIDRYETEKDIALCCTPTFGTAFLPKAINLFMMSNAVVGELKFLFNTPEQAIRGVMDSTYDLAIIEHCDDLDICNLQTLPLPHDELVFITAPHLGVPAPQADLTELLPHRLFVRKDGCSSKRLLMMNLAMKGCELRDFAGMVISDDHRLTIDAVTRGEGTSFVSRSLVTQAIEKGLLRAHHVAGFCQHRNRTVVVNRRSPAEGLARQFLACVFEAMDTPTGTSAFSSGQPQSCVSA